jgi:hypothetical protein
MKSSKLFAGALLVVACGSTGSSGEQTEIDIEAAERGIEQLSTVVPICQGGSNLRSGQPQVAPQGFAWLTRIRELQRLAGLQIGTGMESLSPTRPDDLFGDCGGRVTWPTYNHANGTTSGTLQFDDFCTVSVTTGERNTVDGTISFVNNGTPGAFGPITTSTEADSPGGITFLTQTSGGTTVTSQKVIFTDYLYEPGVPGGIANASNPNEVRVGDSRVTDQLENRTYRQANLLLTDFTTGSGGEQVTVSGRAFRSGGEYFDMSTSSPLLSNSSGDFLGGQITFSGAAGSQAVMTLVPGPTLQATLTVNGTPVTNVPACQ